MFDELFEGNPRDKFFDIVYNANRNLVADELDSLIERVALYELYMAKSGIDITTDEFTKELREIKYAEDSQLEDLKRDLYIHSTGEIVSKNE
jgi:hypothetical protein